MKGYVDGFVIPVEKKNVKAYKRVAEIAGKVYMEYGALEYWECLAEQLEIPGMDGDIMKPFVKVMKLKPKETLFFSYILYKSRKQRDQIMKKVMSDKRILASMEKKMPFDFKRMCFAGFEPVVKFKKK